MKLRSGAKYEFVMYSVLRAAAIDSAKKRSAAVLPRVGVVYSSPAAAAASWLRLDGRAAGEHHAGCLDPGRSEGRLKLPNRRTLEAHIRFAPRAIAAPVARPFVVDAKPARPAHTAVDDDAANV